MVLIWFLLIVGNNIGWSKHHKHSLKKLNHTVVSSIVWFIHLAQYIGGKLIETASDYRFS